MNRRRFPLSWQVARSQNHAPAQTGWITATVPGAVQLDWGKAQDLPPYWVGDNVRHWQGLEESSWTYRAALTQLPALEAGQRLFLVLEGIDYAGEVRLDDQLLHKQEGMETPVHLDLTDQARAGSEISVHIFPAPKSRQEPADRSQADHSCKPAVAYGWDFHPRLIPLGLWRDA